MRPKDAFDATMRRVERLLHLYDLLLNQRERGIRKDWEQRFKKFMRWPVTEKIHRIDGKHSLLILRQGADVSPTEFRHDELSELLRAALVTAVSALDRYCHEMLVEKVMTVVRKSEKGWPGALKKMRVPLRVVKDVAVMGRNGDRRPMNLVRRALREQFHRELTLQRPNEIAEAFSMVGVGDLWRGVAGHMGKVESGKSVKERLDGIVTRRNKIVHEGDLKVHQRGGRPRLNAIKVDQVREDVMWLRKMVEALEKVLRADRGGVRRKTRGG